MRIQCPIAGKPLDGSIHQPETAGLSVHVFVCYQWRFHHLKVFVVPPPRHHSDEPN